MQQPDPLPRGRVLRLQHITRDMVQADRNTVFCFGDNMTGRGFGGQAGAMRGEPNTIGVPTKWKPERGESAYFTDDDLWDGDVRHALRHAFHQMLLALEAGRNVVIPADGLGTGLAELPKRAPKINAAIETAIASLSAHGIEQ